MVILNEPARGGDVEPLAAFAVHEHEIAGKHRSDFFLCKDVNEPRFREVVESLLRDDRVSGIIVRPHPKNLWLGLDEWISSRSDARISRTFGNSVVRDVQDSDIVLAGNSSVLVDAVIAGRPGCYVPGLDYGSSDLHEFVARGLIYPIAQDLGLDLDAIFRFYHRPEWPGVLRFFANVDEDEVSVARRAAALMRELAARLESA